MTSDRVRKLCEAMQCEQDSEELASLAAELIAVLDAKSPKPAALVLPAFEQAHKPAAKDAAKLRIAVVDDNETVRRLLCEALLSHLDFEIVCESSDAAGAIRCTESLQPDVVVLDISLPDMNGIEVVRRLRQIAPSAEILLCSQHDLMSLVKEGLSMTQEIDGCIKELFELIQNGLVSHSPLPTTCSRRVCGLWFELAAQSRRQQH